MALTKKDAPGAPQRAAKPKESPTDIFVAIESGVTNIDGVDYPFNKGLTRVHRGHPLYRACPEFFEPITVHYGVEATTAIPGEQRGE